MCGEYVIVLPSKDLVVGPPPRVRGIHYRGYREVIAVGATPACAGNTQFLP